MTYLQNDALLLNTQICPKSYTYKLSLLDSTMNSLKDRIYFHREMLLKSVTDYIHRSN